MKTKSAEEKALEILEETDQAAAAVLIQKYVGREINFLLDETAKRHPMTTEETARLLTEAIKRKRR
jgi:hypothetical protein